MFSFDEIENDVCEKSIKGNNLKSFPEDYIVLDIETTGLNYMLDEIIEISALKIKNRLITDEYSTLVQPSEPIPEAIEKLTGISNEDLKYAPQINDIIPEFYEFVSDMIIVGHNINFDIQFIKQNSFETDKILNNDYVDTLRLSRYLYRDIENHKLETLANHLSVNYIGAHRALTDCKITYECFEKMRLFSECNPELLSQPISKSNKKKTKHVKSADIYTLKEEFNQDHPLFNKRIVITGTLQFADRKSAMQMIADIGGINADSVTKKTDYVVIGTNQEISTKQKKADEYIAKGIDIKIINENEFKSLLEE